MPLAPEHRRATAPAETPTSARVRPLLSASARLLVSRFSYGVTPALARQVTAARWGPEVVRVAALPRPDPRP